MNPIIFCTFQPCPRQASGDIVLGARGEEKRFPVCQRHAEYITSQQKGHDEVLISQEIVFTDDVPVEILTPNPSRILVS
jgi:hypothetical protein